MSLFSNEFSCVKRHKECLLANNYMSIGVYVKNAEVFFLIKLHEAFLLEKKLDLKFEIKTNITLYFHILLQWTSLFIAVVTTGT